MEDKNESWASFASKAAAFCVVGILVVIICHFTGIIAFVTRFFMSMLPRGLSRNIPYTTGYLGICFAAFLGWGEIGVSILKWLKKQS